MQGGMEFLRDFGACRAEHADVVRHPLLSRVTRGQRGININLRDGARDRLRDHRNAGET
jgi:hypothetical protein